MQWWYRISDSGNFKEQGQKYNFFCIYRPPRGNFQNFLDNIKVLVKQFKGQGKQIFLAGDFNISSLDYSWNTIVRDFFNLDFRNSTFPFINRPTTVTKTSATIIDHILTNSIIDSPLHSGIVKTDIINHFDVFCLPKTNFEQWNI